MSRLTIAAMLLCCLCFMLALLTSNLADAVYDLLATQDIYITDDQLHAMGGQVFWMVFSGVCGVLGKSLISTVFFADGVTELMQMFHDGEMRDDMLKIYKRIALVKDMRTIFYTAEQREQMSRQVAHSSISASDLLGDGGESGGPSSMDKQMQDVICQAGPSGGVDAEAMSQIMKQMMAQAQPPPPGVSPPSIPNGSASAPSSKGAGAQASQGGTLFGNLFGGAKSKITPA